MGIRDAELVEVMNMSKTKNGGRQEDDGVGGGSREKKKRDSG